MSTLAAFSHRAGPGMTTAEAMAGNVRDGRSLARPELFRLPRARTPRRFQLLVRLSSPPAGFPRRRSRSVRCVRMWIAGRCVAHQFRHVTGVVGEGDHLGKGRALDGLEVLGALQPLLRAVAARSRAVSDGDTRALPVRLRCGPGGCRLVDQWLRRVSRTAMGRLFSSQRAISSSSRRICLQMRAVSRSPSSCAAVISAR